MIRPRMVNTIEVCSELWAPVAVLVHQGDGTFALRLMLRDAWEAAHGPATLIDPGQVVHVPVWYGMPWVPSPVPRIPIDAILAAAVSGPLAGVRR